MNYLPFVPFHRLYRHDTEEEEELHPSIHESFVSAEGDYCSGCGHLLSGHPELAYHFGRLSISYELYKGSSRIVELHAVFVAAGPTDAVLIHTLYHNFCQHVLREHVVL